MARTASGAPPATRAIIPSEAPLPVASLPYGPPVFYGVLFAIWFLDERRTASKPPRDGSDEQAHPVPVVTTPHGVALPAQTHSSPDAPATSSPLVADRLMCSSAAVRSASSDRSQAR